MDSPMSFLEITYRFEHIYETKSVYGVAVSPNGSEVYAIISTSSSDEIVKVSCNNNPKIVSTLASSYPMLTLRSKKRFSRLKDIVLSVDGHLYVTDYYNYAVHKIDLEGKDVLIFGSDFGETNGTASETQFKYPTSLCCDDIGNVYIMDYIVSTLRMINVEGISSHLLCIETGIRYDTSLAYDDREHSLFFSSKDYIQQYDLETKQLKVFAESQGWMQEADFYGVATDPTTGNLYVINDIDKSIYIIDRNSKSFHKVEAVDDKGFPLDLKSPIRLRTDQNGTLYVADQKEGIFKITSKKRLKWIVKRLLWIGWQKEKAAECPLAGLPREILFEIINLLEA